MERKSILKKIYRFVLDLVEEITTGFASWILVNSKFTMGVYNRAFKLLQKFKSQPSVVYPAIQESIFNQETKLEIQDILK